MAKSKSPKNNKEKGLSATPVASEVATNSTETPEMSAAATPISMDEPKKSPIKKSTKKPEIVKTETRSNLVPINLEDEIRQLAYLFSERRGFTPGHEAEDWLAAEHEVMQRYQHHQSA